MFVKKQKLHVKDSRKNKWASSEESQKLKATITKLEQIVAVKHEYEGSRLKSDDYLLASLKRKTKLEKMKALVKDKAEYKKANTNHYGRKGVNLGDFWKKDGRSKNVSARG